MGSRWENSTEREAFRLGASRANQGLSRSPLYVQRYTYNERAAFRDGFDTVVELQIDGGYDAELKARRAARSRERRAAMIPAPPNQSGTDLA